jgi:hypothetical protein
MTTTLTFIDANTDLDALLNPLKKSYSLLDGGEQEYYISYKSDLTDKDMYHDKANKCFKANPAFATRYTKAQGDRAIKKFAKADPTTGYTLVEAF